MPTYTNLNKCQKDKLHKIIMRMGRMTLNSYCFKKSIEYILGQCNWFDINEMIKLSSLKFIHQVITSANPPTLYSKLKLNKRSCSDISFFRFPKQKAFKNTVLFKGIYYYNKIPSELRKLSIKHFNSKLKKERHLLKQIQD